MNLLRESILRFGDNLVFKNYVKREIINYSNSSNVFIRIDIFN